MNELPSASSWLNYAISFPQKFDWNAKVGLSLGGSFWKSTQNGPTRPHDHFSRFWERTWPKAFARGTPTIVAPKTRLVAFGDSQLSQTPVQCVMGLR